MIYTLDNLSAVNTMRQYLHNFNAPIWLAVFNEYVCFGNNDKSRKTKFVSYAEVGLTHWPLGGIVVFF